MRIAVDAMGGDYAPWATVGGAVEAARISKGRYEIVLVGDENKIRSQLANYRKIKSLRISIYHAPEKIEMGEPPTSVLKKKNSSISVAIELQKEGVVDAVVSAGNTGAVMTSSTLILGRIKGINRPAIGSFIPNEKGICFLIDVGANIDCKPINLLQFGIMGSIYVSHITSCKSPKVGLLSVGEEETKGNELTVQAHTLLKQSPINFAGNVEGRDILKGTTEVVVCDGFVGNIILKFTESIDGVYSTNLKRRIGKKIFANLGAFILRPTLDGLRRIFDYEEYGGVPLLGINGVSIICHGGSSPKAIRNAILEAEKMVRERVNQHIAEEINKIGGERN